MKRPLKSILIVSAIFAGFFSFLINGMLFDPLFVISLMAGLFFTWRWWRSNDSLIELMFPFSSGILTFFMRLFYWDGFDLALRINNLILISFLFSLFLVCRHLRIFPRVLRFFNRFSLKKRLLLIFVFFETVFILSSYVMVVEKKVVLVGDEPHYLAVAQSIARDGDLNVFNQYYRDGYKEFIAVDKLKAHAAFGRGFKKMYSYHLPGISLTISPFMAGKIPPPLLYFLLRAYLALFGSLLMVVIYLFSLRLWKHKSFSLFITLVFGSTTPIFFHSFHIFPEVQALLLILSSLYLALYAGNRSSRYLLSGLLLSITVFWGLKYTIFIYLFCAGFFFYLAFKKKYKQALLFVVFPLLFQVLFFYYLYFAYGNFSPHSIYRGMMSADQSKALYNSLLTQIPWRLRIETLLDYFLDQRDGLLLYSPLYFFALPGLVLAFKRIRHYSRHIWISVPALAYILYHALSTVRAGYCPQARYLVPVMWFLLLFTAIYYRETKNRVLKHMMLFLPLYSIIVTFYQVVNPFTLYQHTTHDSLFRPGLLFQQWSNSLVSLPDLLPSFAKVEGNFKYLPNLIVLALILVLGWISLRKAGRKKMTFVLPLIFIVSIFQFALFPRIRLYNPVVVQRTGVIPHRIHGASPYPGKASRWLFHLKDTGIFPMTISSPRPSASMQIELTNKGLTHAEFDIFLFDQLLTSRKLPAGEKFVFTVKEPQQRKFKGSFFYRFYVRVKDSGSEDPWLVGEFYPQRLSANR